MIVMVLPDPVDDDTLLKRARQGDKSAMTIIYRQYVDPIYQFCRLRLGNPQQAEDITSTVFTRFIQSITQGNGPDRHLRGWLFQVARHAIYDSYGKKQPLPVETIGQWENLNSIDPEYEAYKTINADVLREHVAMLSNDQQDVLLLRFDQQLSIRETADILGKNENTVKALQFRAIKRLRDLLQRSGMTSL
ncbi:MAG: RNA polymerase sigma factor [Anaerolineae bacterium]